jgi:hypothetical protein
MDDNKGYNSSQEKAKTEYIALWKTAVANINFRDEDVIKPLGSCFLSLLLLS